MSRPTFIAIALFALATIGAIFALNFIYRLNRHLFGNDDVGMIINFGVIMGACWLVSMLPWSLTIRSRFKVLGKRKGFGWLPAILWIAGVLVIGISWGTLGQTNDVPNDVVTPEDFSEFLKNENLRLDMFVYIGFGGATLMALGLLVAIGLSFPALKADPQPVDEAFD